MVNLVYGFVETFAIIHAVTSGGRARDRDPGLQDLSRRREGLDLGGSSARSVILMLIVIALAVLQSRYVERRVQYQ